MSVLYVGIFGVIVADRSVGIRRYLNKNTDRYLPTGSLMIWLFSVHIPPYTTIYHSVVQGGIWRVKSG